MSHKGGTDKDESPLGRLLVQHVDAVMQLEQGAIVTKGDDYYGGRLAGLRDRGWAAVAEYCQGRGAFPDLAKGMFGHWHLRLTRKR